MALLMTCRIRAQALFEMSDASIFFSCGEVGTNIEHPGRRECMPDLAAAQAVLRSVFGFADFRRGQDAIVESVLSGADVLAVMPTGSGKSLCYQLPALLRHSLTVVVSPLIALMRNQVARLKSYGIAAASLNSGNDLAENAEIATALDRGALRLLYVSPERLAKPDTLARLKRANVGLLAVDEAHCISQWGH